jgi:hypothetical protein
MAGLVFIFEVQYNKLILNFFPSLSLISFIHSCGNIVQRDL